MASHIILQCSAVHAENVKEIKHWQTYVEMVTMTGHVYISSLNVKAYLMHKSIPHL